MRMSSNKNKSIKKSLQNLGTPRPIFGTLKKKVGPILKKAPGMVVRQSVKKTFRDARKTLEERANPVKEPMRNWDESEVEYVKRYKRDRREALLFECVPHRRCPICRKVRLKSAQWFVIKQKRLAKFKSLPEWFEIFEAYLGKVICRSCVKTADHALKKGDNK